MERQKTFSFGKQTRTFYTLHILRPWATEQWLSWTRLTIPAGGGGGGDWTHPLEWSEYIPHIVMDWVTDKWWHSTENNQLMHEKAKNVFCRGKFGEIPLNTQWCHCSSSLIVCVCFKETSLWRQKATKVSRFHFISKCVIPRFEWTENKYYKTTTKITKITFFKKNWDRIS